MSFIRVLIAALFTVSVLPVPAQQDESGVFFSLASNRTFSPSDKPTVQLWAQRVDSLQFRLYRVNNATKFFQSLADPHTMNEGLNAAAPKGGQTPLERFHSFKRLWRMRMRNMFRAQFTRDNRAVIHEKLSTPASGKTAPGKAENYAAVPVLNPQQLVSVWQQTVPHGGRWDAQTVAIETPGKGIYVVEATDGRLRAFTIIQVSEMVVISKGVPGRLLTQVVNRNTGEPVQGCALLVWAGSQELGRGSTGVDGLAEFPFTANQLEHVVVMAKKGEDFAADSVYGYSLNTNTARQWMGYVYTDRPMYRPGHTVYYRAVIRALVGPGYRMPGVSEVDVEVQDNEGKPVTRKKASVSAFGTVNGEFELPSTASLGYYNLQMRSGEAMVSGGFEVQEYKKPEYEVRVMPEKRRVVQGEPIKATIQARYYFGEPVTNAKVTWVAHKGRYWYPLYADEVDEEQPGDGGEEGGYANEQTEEQTGQTDSEGRLQIVIPNSVQTDDLIYRIEARVTDQANREISGAAAVIATVGSFLVHAEPDQYVYSPGSRGALNIETRDYDGNPVQTDFQVSLNAWAWNRGEGRQEVTGSGRTDAQGKARFEFKLPDGGSYRASVTAVTPEKRVVNDTAYLWISGGADFWTSGRRERLQIVPDKKSYTPGETARILLVTGAPKSTVLVTVEGKDLYSSQVVRTDSPTATIAIPVRAEHEPNFFVSASFVKDGQLFQGAKSIKVPPTEHKLTVDLKPSKPTYKPGEAAAFVVEAHDSAGKPATAEFSLGVVDDAIYAIRKDMVQDIVNFFYGRGWNRVSTSTSLSYYFQGQAGRRQMQLAQLKRHSLAQLKPERLVDAKVRKAFPDTTYWSATLRTGADGRAEARFNFPDSLTTWRATARGITEDAKVGSAVNRVIVRKNLILRLSTPRFLRDGDEVTVSALVHNYLTDAKTARVSLDAQGADVLEGGTKDVNVPSMGEARVDYKLRAKPGANVVLSGKALTDQESDALEITLPVIPFGVKLSDARSGSITDASGAADASLTFPQQAAPWSRTLEISASPSIAGALYGALDYLTSFPYGCVEQTMSSFLPNVIVSKAAKDLGMKSNIDEAALQKKIRAGLDRLYDFQHEDGGWGWWKNDESHPFMTPYVIAGLLQGRAAGTEVRDEVITRGAAWLRGEFQQGKGNADLRAYMVYALALAGQGDKATLDTAWNERSKMTPYGLSLFGLALKQGNDARAGEAARLVEAAAKSSESEAWWPASRDQLLDFTTDATPEATAFAMKFLTAVQPQSPLLAKAAAWLVNHRRGGYYWDTTKQTAMVIYGITDYLKLGAELSPDFAVTVTLNGKQVMSKRFTKADALAPAPLSVNIPADQLAGGKSDIHVIKSGGGRLYWSARADYFSTEGGISKTGGAAMSLQRDYFRVVPVRQGEKIVHRLEPLTGTLVSGEVIAARLTLRGDDQRYLIIEDPIPAGAEFIERDDLYELLDRPGWWGYWYTRREFHDDRAALFQTYFPRGQQQYTYLMKIVNPGRFRVSPAMVQPMYQPQIISTTESRTLEVR